jgi:hypothetical protein
MRRFDPRDTSYDVRSDIVVVGYDPEMADMDNPRGERHGLRWLVIATNAHGDRKGMVVPSEAVALSMVGGLIARAARGQLPVGFLNHWHAERPAYGSPAYEEYGAADDIALEREEE